MALLAKQCGGCGRQPAVVQCLRCTAVHCGSEECLALGWTISGHSCGTASTSSDGAESAQSGSGHSARSAEAQVARNSFSNETKRAPDAWVRAVAGLYGHRAKENALLRFGISAIGCTDSGISRLVSFCRRTPLQDAGSKHFVQRTAAIAAESGSDELKFIALAEAIMDKRSLQPDGPQTITFDGHQFVYMDKGLSKISMIALYMGSEGIWCDVTAAEVLMPSSSPPPPLSLPACTRCDANSRTECSHWGVPYCSHNCRNKDWTQGHKERCQEKQ